jgi:predicted PurR-regulated permease PerM
MHKITLALNRAAGREQDRPAVLTLAAVAAVVASTLLFLLDTLVLWLAHKPAGLAALVSVLTCSALAALVVRFISPLVSCSCQAQQQAQAVPACLLVICSLLAGLATLLPLGDAHRLLVLQQQQQQQCAS